MVTTPTAPPSSFEDVVLASVLLGLLTIGTIFGNGLVCMAFHKIRSLRTVTNYFVVSLAVADLLVGFVSMPLWFMSVAFHWPTPKSSSQIYVLWMCLDIATATASIMNLAVISVDRFYAITSPLQYPINLTKCRARISIVLIWAYAVGVAVIRATPLFSVWYSYFIASASFFVPLPVMIFCYVRIFRVARVQAMKMRKLDGVMAHARIPVDRGPVVERCENPHMTSRRLIVEAGGHSHLRKQRTSFISEMKAAKILAIVMGAFVLCWAPYIITLLVDVSCFNCIPDARLKILAQVVKWLHYSNSLVNPIIYTMLNRGFREGFQRVLCQSSQTPGPCTRNQIVVHFDGGGRDVPTETSYHCIRCV